MSITMGSIIGLMNQAASDSQQGANAAGRNAVSARLDAEAEDRRQKGIISAEAEKANREKQEFENNLNKAGQFEQQLSTGFAPVSPVEQASLISLLPMDQQNYAASVYNLLADRG